MGRALSVNNVLPIILNTAFLVCLAIYPIVKVGILIVIRVIPTNNKIITVLQQLQRLVLFQKSNLLHYTAFPILVLLSHNMIWKCILKEDIANNTSVQYYHLWCSFLTLPSYI